MKTQFAKTSALLPHIMLTVALLAIGWWITHRAGMPGGNSPESIIYHYMWLDAWNLVFVGVIVAFWCLRSSATLNATFVFVSIAIYGVVALVLILAPSQFPDNAYWGDQKFRIAMIEHFMARGSLTDYYYKGLPIFYPPVYYYVLALLGKLTGHPGYKMAQVGLGLLFIVAPICLYALWRKVLSAGPALIVTAAVILVDVGGSFMLVAVPHAFLANSLFVPWCLYYIMGLGATRRSGWKKWLVGSIIGAAIFSTYFYPFFVLGFGLAVGAVVAIMRKDRLKAVVRYWPMALVVVLGVGLFSAPYWAPNVIAVLKFGVDRSRGDWYHATSGGLGFPFLEFNWTGAAGLVAIGVALWRWKLHVFKGMLWLLAASLALFMIGSVLGALDMSINLTKDREFTWALLTPLIGLGFYTLAKKMESRRGGRVVAIGMLAILLLFCVRGMTTLAHDSSIERARNQSVPDVGLSDHVRMGLADKVILSSEEECFAFVPAYAFLNINEHYAHPASQFAMRYDFLAHLCRIHDPQLFHYALRHNRFDAIDYIKPERKGDSILLYTALSNYPNGLNLKQLSFPAKFLDDTLYYRRVEGSGFFAVRESAAAQSGAKVSMDPFADSIEQLTNVLGVMGRLESSVWKTSPSVIDSAKDEVFSCLDPSRPLWIDKRLLLIDCNAVARRDSVYLLATFRKNRPILDYTRIYLHVYTLPNKAEFQNYDFPPSISVDQWGTGDVVSVSRAFPNLSKSIEFVLGIFNDEGACGRALNGHIDLSAGQ